MKGHSIKIEDNFTLTRHKTLELISGLPIEDLCIQPAAFVSPLKWHIGHTTWIFEKIINEKDQNPSINSQFDFIFNSYYKGLGAHNLQANRGSLSRPTVDEIIHYFHQINDQVLSKIKRGEIDSKMIELGIQHEKQHQELMIMDLKYILSQSLGLVNNVEHFECYTPTEIRKNNWSSFDGGIKEFGANNDGAFYFDNEMPRHQEIIRPFEIQSTLVTNGDFLEFLNADAYQRSELWLSDGWDWVNRENIRSPLYWFHDGKTWQENFFGQRREINLQAPVSHISFYEADAYARFCEKRLPSEFELELSLNNQDISDLWIWSNSSYHPYPGFKPFKGFAKEYNGKFMSGQLTLRGGCIATPENHYRSTYRNFYRPENRWQFSGIKLAKDIK